MPGPVRRLAARFALLAFGFYHVPLFLNDYPMFGGGGGETDGLSQAWGQIFGQVGLWIARHVFRLTGPMPNALDGDNGDTSEEYARLLVGVAIAAIAAVIWTIADRRRPRAPWVERVLHLLLRYAIALGLASYALAKIFPVQFGELDTVALESRVGELSPMRLMWHFMEYSRPYSMFAGIMELSVVLLVAFRRTATLGALLCLVVMTNVALLDICYDVPVKLFSASMAISAAVLVVYDAPRLAAAVLRRPLPPPPVETSVVRSRRWRVAGWLVKIVLIGGVLISSAVVMRSAGTNLQPPTSLPLEGMWNVTSFVQAGQELVQTAAPARWRRVVIGSWRGMIRFEDDTIASCTAQVDAAAHTLALSCSKGRTGVLSYTRDGARLQLDGSFDHMPVIATLQRRADSDIPLRRAKFHWMWETGG
ncbi:MAG TPA: hypothetical protein VH165_04280 [Kofleriaceae bacterium]|jgi:hypothetical protein|nr:hypothetical protein [Kofleriaceae bacterium]